MSKQIKNIHIIGLSVQADLSLSEAARMALSESTVVIASRRQWGIVNAVAKNLLAPNVNFIELAKLAELKPLIDSLKDQRITLLASGDPLYFGIGRYLSKQFQASQLKFYPAISSITAVCNHLALSQQDCQVVSLHGRAFSSIRRVLKRNRTLIILTDAVSNPKALAQECVAANFSDSEIWVCEDIGSSDENYRRFGAKQLAQHSETKFSNLNVTVISVKGEGGVLPEFPGIDDYSFVTDGEKGRGMFTKRETRLAILALMQPANDDVIWDIGAGCGGVSTELSLWNDRVTVYAIEQNSNRLKCLTANQSKFGTISNLKIIQARAPKALEKLPEANKVFIGGNDGELQLILDYVWQQLPPAGLLLASSVTSKTQQLLTEFALKLNSTQTETIQLAVNKAEILSDDIQYRQMLPVTLFKFVKEGL